MAKVMFESTRTVPRSKSEDGQLQFEIGGDEEQPQQDGGQAEDLDGPLGRYSGGKSA